MAIKSEQALVAKLLPTALGLSNDLGHLSNSIDPALAEIARLLRQQQDQVVDSLRRLADGYKQ